MVNGIELEKYNQLAVRISYKKTEDLRGSGFLFCRGLNKNAFVLTAAHVTHSFRKEDYADLLLQVLLKDGSVEKLTCLEICEHSDYVHDPTGDSTANDASVIFVQYETWMENLPMVSIAEPSLGAEQIGYGFPGSEEKEGIYGRTEVSGHISDLKPGTWWVELSYEANTLGKKLTRQQIMEGYSGCGILQMQDAGMTYSGAMSGGAGDETAGTKARITKGNLFADMLNARGIDIYPPVDLNTYIRNNVDMIEADNEQARAFFRDAMEELTDPEEDDIGAEDFLQEDGRDLFRSLPCAGVREHCPHYWQGQLTSAVCCCKILGQDVASLPDLKVQIEDEDVNVAVFCTEQPVEECMRRMLDEHFFAENGIVQNNTILLWANPNRQMYYQITPKYRGQNIINNIIRRAEYGKRDLKARLGKEGSFHIVDGMIRDFNIGIVGIGKLNSEVIAGGNGKASRMEKRLTRILEEVWEQDDE